MRPSRLAARLAPQDEEVCVCRERPTTSSPRAEPTHAPHPEVRGRSPSLEGRTAPSNVGEAMRTKLAGFVRTLRDNGFTVGLAETRDALSILASPAATRASALRPAFRALFSADRSDFQRFDEIFAAFWTGQRRAAAVPDGERRAARARTPPRRTKSDSPHGKPGMPDRAERGAAGDDASADGRGRREGASHAEALESADIRHIVDPDEIARTHALAERLGADDAGAHRPARARASARAAPRPPPHHPPQCLAWRHADRARFPAAQAEAAAPGRAARCVRLDEPLHGVLRPLPARRGRCLPRGGGVRVPYAARARLAVACATATSRARSRSWR